VNRRTLLAAVAGLGLTGGAAYVSLGGTDVRNRGANDGTTTASGNDRPDLPMTVETLSAPGSTAGSQQVPVADTPTVIDLFATWCVPCQAQMDALGTVHDDYGDQVAFVSVTNEQFGDGFSREDVRDWWVENGGDWTVGHDPGSNLLRALRANGLPFLAVANAAGEVVWTHRGTASQSTLEREVQRVLDA
jgi:thiol-disulfide isomerase/thioredoxin